MSEPFAFEAGDNDGGSRALIISYTIENAIERFKIKFGYAPEYIRLIDDKTIVVIDD